MTAPELGARIRSTRGPDRAGRLAVAAGARVAELRLRVLRLQRLALRVELLLGAVAAVGGARGDELLGELLVDRQPLHLPVGADGAADVRALVPVEAEPVHVAEDDRLVLGRAPLVIGVLDAEDERAARLARPEPVEERRAHAADVEVAGRRGGEAEAGLARGHGRAS